MTTTTKSTLAALLLALVASPLLLVAQGDSGDEITPLTKEQLTTKVPQFYCFDYPFEPQPGKRYWIRVSDDKWIERYPDGLESVFKVLGHTTIKDTQGIVVVKVSGDSEKTGTPNDSGLQAFIPDKGSKLMHHWYRNNARGDDDWNDLAEMRSVE